MTRARLGRNPPSLASTIHLAIALYSSAHHSHARAMSSIAASATPEAAGPCLLTEHILIASIHLAIANYSSARQWAIVYRSDQNVIVTIMCAEETSDQVRLGMKHNRDRQRNSDPHPRYATGSTPASKRQACPHQRMLPVDQPRSARRAS